MYLYGCEKITGNLELLTTNGRSVDTPVALVHLGTSEHQKRLSVHWTILLR